jgi:hypothetical protein
MGKKEKSRGTLGTSIAKVFDMTVAATGNNEKILKRLGVPLIGLSIAFKNRLISKTNREKEASSFPC